MRPSSSPHSIQVRNLELRVPTADAPGYALAQSADLGALEQDIVAAMRQGTFITVEIADGSQNGVLVVNGAALPLAVLCPPNP